jgi:hypothetical protein
LSAQAYGKIEIPVEGQERKVTITWSRQDEMDAFDMLGPLMRRTMTELPGNVVAFPIIQECIKLDLNPNDPAVDAMLSHNVRQLTAKWLSGDKYTAEDVNTSMIPLRAKRTLRSHRSY